MYNAAAWGPATLSLLRCTLERNFSGGKGGAVWSGGALEDVPASLHVSHCTFRENTADGGGKGSDAEGGAIYSVGTSDVTVLDSLFEGNRVSRTAEQYYPTGGAISSQGRRLTIQRCTFNDNFVQDGPGSAIFSATDEATVTDCTFLGEAGPVANATERPGSGLPPAAGRMSVTNCTFYNNGLGFLNYAAPASLVNCTFSCNQLAVGNFATPSLGGISHLEVINCTFVTNGSLDPEYVPNVGVQSAGNVYNYSSIIQATVVMASNVLGLPSAGGINVQTFINPDTGGVATITSAGYNLSEDESGGYLNQATDILNTDPMLGQLADNGGLTLTHALLPGSPALDRIPSVAGTDFPATDQRGVARPQGTLADIGAFELLLLRGDLNGDGCVDRDDLTLLLAKVRARSTDLAYGVNGDGRVNIADARKLVLLFSNPGGAPCPQVE
ncbi:MAG: hypothetical protein L0Z50_42465 [Verrucomicrobiales bacterium]|nr:hypothetical protein [Verrucomicrobiales bacterium]